ncbi:MAG: DUF1624 domain-containing protein, partial [Spirochaetales bacterium]|nr:DUF1624 domain-containing protein [Spirochaetales bacterium]
LAIDALRGALVVLMVVYHACYVAELYALVSIDLYSGFWWFFPRFIAAGFVALSGWNLAGKRARGKLFGDFAKRAGTLALIALLISVATWPVLDKRFVFFGVIHLIAASSVLAYPLLGRPLAATAVGAVVLATGLLLGPYRFDFAWLAWLGLRPAGLYPADYLPLLPWFAYVAFGAATRDVVCKFMTCRATPVPTQRPLTNGPAHRGLKLATATLAAVGKRSLVVYLAHLPLLYGAGWVISAITR